MVDRIWAEQVGEGCLVAIALHDGHQVRDDVLRFLEITAEDRMREEDPFTAHWTTVAPTRLIGLRSRFEVDLNRPRDRAVYLSPVDSWGLKVWRDPPADEVVQTSLEEYDLFYARLSEILTDKSIHGPFVVYDIHSYNHRRGGPSADPADEDGHPQVNVGTGTMDRTRWAPVVDRFMRDLSAFDFPGRRLDVRENVKFFGGAMARWIHQKFPETGCCLSIEFKKFFMDEWTGTPITDFVDGIGAALAWTATGVVEEVAKIESARLAD